MAEENAVALWYMRYHSPGYWLCEDEEEAASMALGMEDAGNGVALGVQFPDGRTIARGDWPAYAEAQRRQDEAERRAWAEQEAAPPRPMREIKDPFGGRALKVESDEPSWLGQLGG
jgi:hypothetical protein